MTKSITATLTSSRNKHEQWNQQQFV